MAGGAGDDQRRPQDVESGDELERLLGEAERGPYGVEISQDYDPSQKFVIVFPVGAREGATNSTVAYSIFEPGTHSGLHADNAEEIVYVADGEGEVFLSGRQLPLEAGSFVVLPQGVQHDVYAYGDVELRLLSFFPTPELVSTFQEVILPIGSNVLTSRPPAPVVQELTLDELPPDFPFELLGGGAPLGAPADADAGEERPEARG